METPEQDKKIAEDKTPPEDKRVGKADGNDQTAAAESTIDGDIGFLDEEKDTIILKGSRSVRFPVRLHFILEDVERNGMTDIVSWLPDGKSFKIHKRQEFIDEVLLKYFNAVTFKSFQRNYHAYGFQVVPKGRYKGVTSHPDFVRGDLKRCSKMQRVFTSRPDCAKPRGRLQRLLQLATGDTRPKTPEEKLKMIEERRRMLKASQEKTRRELEIRPTKRPMKPRQKAPEILDPAAEAARQQAINSMKAAAIRSATLAPRAVARRGEDSSVTDSVSIQRHGEDCSVTDSLSIQPNPVPSEGLIALNPTSAESTSVKICSEALVALAREHKDEREEIDAQLEYLHVVKQQQIERQGEQKRLLLEQLTAQMGLPVVAQAIESMLESD